ncbi:unnamed protein product [Caenorhabditis auriculariae]|uniref:SAC3/GANP/THP3 conserved domain-containing protein n=1 Tax=Caenorhabditis auriculariae TaxID=2777116 RepID=A0A8S1HHK6_9PELO|nr:unnamed protein product [Caenorhabditis auriculariae]
MTATCQHMCPPSEVSFRNENRLIHQLEATTSTASGKRSNFVGDPAKMVKEYTRSAADTNHSKSSLLRPFSVLKRTIEYLTKLYDDLESTETFPSAFSFVSDRLRAVRQDMVMQRMPAGESVELLQLMIPFYLTSDYRCKTSRCVTYEWKLHATQIEECLCRWAEQVRQLPRESPIIDENVLMCFILRQAQKSTAIQELKEALKVISIGFKHPTAKLPLSMLSQWLGLDPEQASPKKSRTKVKLDEADLKKLIEGGDQETSDQDSDDEKQEGDEGEEKARRWEKCALFGIFDHFQKKGLRGAGAEVEDEKMEEGGDTDEQYLKEYDDDHKEDNERGMRGIAMYTSNQQDPYVTEHVDSDEEEEADEIHVRPDDNMVAVAKIHRDEYTLEVYVYNEKDGDWYCHHDHILDAPPLCLEHIEHDPGNDETGKGNLVAVGTMKSEIHIWDLDIMNSVTPVVTLGKGAASKSSRKKRDCSAQGHSDAVISLSWNRLTSHVLASGGADQQVVLWDLDEAKAAQIFGARGGEVQSISWHPNESTFLLLGTMKGLVQVLDCRETNGTPSAEWKFGGQVEKVIWNHFNPFTAFVTTDDGHLRYLDMRKPGEAIFDATAHEGAIGGISLSAKTRGLLATAGEDQMLNVWKADETSLTKVHSEKLSIGPLHCLQFNPDVATVVSVGGSASDLIRVMDLSKYEPVVSAFSQ